MELLEVPSDPRWKSSRGLGLNRVSRGDQAPDHSACEEAHPEEAGRLMTIFPPPPLSPSPDFARVTKANSNGASEEETIDSPSSTLTYPTYTVTPVGWKF